MLFRSDSVDYDSQVTSSYEENDDSNYVTDDGFSGDYHSNMATDPADDFSAEGTDSPLDDVTDRESSERDDITHAFDEYYYDVSSGFEDDSFASGDDSYISSGDNDISSGDNSISSDDSSDSTDDSSVSSDDSSASSDDSSASSDDSSASSSDDDDDSSADTSSSSSSSEEKKHHRRRMLSDVPVCDAGEDVYSCSPLLCLYSYCPGRPGAQCRVRPCGGCHVEWYEGEQQVTDQCSAGELPFTLRVAPAGMP